MNIRPITRRMAEMIRDHHAANDYIHATFVTDSELYYELEIFTHEATLQLRDDSGLLISALVELVELTDEGLIIGIPNMVSLSNLRDGYYDVHDGYSINVFVLTVPVIP